MRVSKFKIGVATAVTGASLLAGGLLFGSSLVSAQTPPTNPTPGAAPTRPAPGQQPQQTPGQPGQPGEGSAPRDAKDCPKDGSGGEGGMRPGGRGGQAPDNSSTPGSGTSFGSAGLRTLRQ